MSHPSVLPAHLRGQVSELHHQKCPRNRSVASSGQIEGFDIDFCKAFAAAVFGTDSPEEGTHYELIPVDADARFNALRAGEFDVLVRNTTWTSSRDGAEGVSFAHPNFYDGQAILAPANDFASLEDLDGANICVTTGTTTELNLADYFAAQDLTFEPVVLEDYEVIFEAFRQNRCDAVTGDRSALQGLLPLWEEDVPNLTIFEDVISKEPLAPGVLDGDDEWFDVVNMVVNGIILAEELGVSGQNVDQEIQSPSDPFVGALLGVPVQEGEELGLGFDPGIGIDAIAARVLELNLYLTLQLERNGFDVLSPAGEHRSGQTLVALPQPRRAAEFLAERGVLVTQKPQGVRISTHFFNNEQDIDACLRGLVAYSESLSPAS